MVFAYKDCSFSTGDRDGLKIRISPKIRSKITIKWKFERKYPQSQPVSLILKYIHFHTPGSKSLDKYFVYNPINKEKNPTFFAENMLGRRFIREKCRHCKCLKKCLHMIMDSTLINFDRIDKIIVYPTLGFYYGSNSWISLCSLFIFALLSTASKPTTSNLVLVSS